MQLLNVAAAGMICNHCDTNDLKAKYLISGISKFIAVKKQPAT
jgi:hypothetical protein